MQSIRRSFLVTALFGGVLFPFHPVDAQYSANYQTNIISGVTSNWVGDYIVGNTTFADALLIQNSGVLSNDNGYIGYEAGANNNTVLVSVPARCGAMPLSSTSVTRVPAIASSSATADWSPAPTPAWVGTAITTAATPTPYWSREPALSGAIRGYSCLVIPVRATGLIIANGGQAYDGGARVGGTPGDDFNMVVVSGTGPVWNSGRHLAGLVRGL